MKNILLITALAALWWLGGFLAGAGLSAYFDGNWTIPCASLNLTTGMIMLLLVTRNERARRLFYVGPKEDEPGSLIIAVLWILPFSLMVAGIIWWLMAQFFE